MKLALDSFYAVHTFKGISNAFMHYKPGGGFVETTDPSEAEKFDTIEDAERFIAIDEDAMQFVSELKNCRDIFIAKVEIVANVKTCKRIS